MDNNRGSTTLRDYLRVIFRYKILFIIIPTTIMIPIYIWLQMVTPRYKANVKMLVKAQKQIEAEYYKGIFSQQNITAEHTELVASNIVLERVVEALKLYEIPLDYEMQFATPLKRTLMERGYKELFSKVEKMTPEQKERLFFNTAMGRLSGSVDAMPLKDSSLFTISVRDFDPDIAAKIANSVSRSYIIFDLEQQIAELKLKYGERHSTVIQLENYIEEFKSTLDGRILPDIEAIGPASVKIIEQAQGAERVRIFSKGFLLTLAFFSGIFISVIFSFILEFLDNTFKSPPEVERELGIPVLGTLPKKKPKNRHLTYDAKSEATNYFKSYQSLSEQVYLLAKEKNWGSIIITDAEGLDETSTIIGNLGIYLGNRQMHRVLIIDANLRSNSLLPRFFNISNTTGLGDVLNGKKHVADAVHKLSANLYFLPSGSSVQDPVSLLKTSQLSDLIKKAKEQYDIVLIYCANLMNHTDSVLLSSYTDGVILVISEGKTRRLVLKRAIAPLVEKKVNIIGAILDNRTYVIPGIIYRIT